MKTLLFLAQRRQEVSAAHHSFLFPFVEWFLSNIPVFGYFRESFASPKQQWKSAEAVRTSDNIFGIGLEHDVCNSHCQNNIQIDCIVLLKATESAENHESHAGKRTGLPSEQGEDSIGDSLSGTASPVKAKALWRVHYKYSGVLLA